MPKQGEHVSRGAGVSRLVLLALLVLPGISSATGAPGAAIPAGPFKTLRGPSIQLADFRNRFVLFLFSAEDSKEEAKKLLRDHAQEFLPLEGLVVLSVIDPGSGAKMTSRGSLAGRVRKEIDRENARIVSSLPEASRPAFDRQARHEVIDWDGSLTRAFGAPPGQVGMLLIGPDGDVARPVEVADTATVRGVIRLVDLGPEAYLKGRGRGERIERLLETIEGK